MQKQTIDGHEVEFELADENFPKDRAMPFHVKTLDGQEYDKWHVVIAPKGKEHPDNPIDGHICAICLIKQDAMMVAAAVNIARQVAETEKGFTERLEALKETSAAIARRSGWDIDQAEAKMDELIKAGKSKEEIIAFFKEHMSDFRKPDAPKDDAPKTAEEW